MLGKVFSCFSCFGGSSSRTSRMRGNARIESSRTAAAAPAKGNPLSGSRPGSSAEAGSNTLPVPRYKQALEGYLMARAALNRKIDNTPEIEWKADGSMEKRGNALKHLVSANETVEQTHALLPYGRGNVTVDNQRTGYESSRRDEAAMRLLDDIPLQGEPQEMLAALFRFTQAGRCGGSAVISTHLHAPKLEEPYRVSTVELQGVDHTFTETTRKDGRKPDDAIIDPWLDGPAVQREDALYGDSKTRTLHELDKSTGPAAAEKVERITAKLESDPRNRNLLNYYIGTGEMDYHSGGYRRYGTEFEPRPVYHPDFQEAAGKALHGEGKRPAVEGKPGQSRLNQEIQAVGVALSLNGGPLPASPSGPHSAGPAAPGNIRDALAQAPGIIEAAKRQFPAQ